MSNAADFRQKAREALGGKWPLAVGTGFIAALLGAGSRGGRPSKTEWREPDDFLHTDIGRYFFMIMLGIISVMLIWALITFVIGGGIELGYCRCNKNLINGTNPKFTDLFSRMDIFWKAFGLRLLIVIYIILWSILLIIPGIIAALNYSMAFYIMEENPSMSISEAMNQSKLMMQGNRWRLVCLGFSFIGWLILCGLTLGIGMLWLYPYMNAAFAAFYLEISGKQQSLT
jgi:uncharacterized membrane protein